MAEFSGQDLHGSRFDRVDLGGSVFSAVDLRGSRFRSVAMDGVVMRDVDLVGVDITGEIVDVIINGIDVGPLIEAELDRRHPGRALMRPTDAEGFRAGWALLEERWRETVDRAQRLDSDLLHESVDHEWSFIETLRHLLFVTDSWIRRAVLGDPFPWHPLDLPWDEMPDTPGVPRDRTVRPSLDALLELRRDRMAGVRALLEGLTDEALAGRTERVDAPGWPQPRSYPLRGCLLNVLNEEWHHRQFAERDLAVLEARAS